MKNLFAVVKVTDMWNTLDVSKIEGSLREDVEFISELRMGTISGRDSVINHLRDKLFNIHSEVQSGNMGLYAQNVKLDSNKREAFCQLLYCYKKTFDYILIRVKVDDTKITSIECLEWKKGNEITKID